MSYSKSQSRQYKLDLIKTSLVKAQYYPYKHYSRHSVNEPIYDNETIVEHDDDNGMCHLTVRCPSVPTLYPYDRDGRNRRFSVDSFLAMHGPSGPPGISGPQGNPGPRGAVGSQGDVGRSKEPVPIVAFVAYLQKMLSVESNRSEPCQSNSTLNELQLIGNNIPDDIMQSIANALSKNTEQHQIHFGHSQNMAILSRQLQNVHEEKDRQITTTLTRMSLQEQAMLKANKSLAEKLKKLQDALDERKLSFNALSSKNTLLEADLTVAKQQYDDIQNVIKKMEIDKQELIYKIRRECKQEKDELIDIQEKLQRDLNASLEIQRRLNEKIQDLERKNDKLQTTVHELGETITINERDYQIKLTALDDENQRLKLKQKEDLKDRELITNRDIQRLKEAHSSTEQTLKEQLTKLENIRTSLEREINSLKSNLSTQKLAHDETLQEEKIRIKNNEEKKQQELEDRIHTLTTSKDELESRYNQQLIAYRELQQKLNFQSVEIESFKRQIESIQMTIHDKDTEILETREKTKTDYEKKLRSIQKDIDMNDELKDRIKQLENELKDQRFNDRNTIRELESRVAELQTTLNHRDQEISRLKLDEEQRLHFLRSAIIDYIGTGANT
ncbi:unnamed protein product [Rotaria sp. Silwood1]|nr:unnamed protein product [Rotaria sp. Silwood1]